MRVNHVINNDVTQLARARIRTRVLTLFVIIKSLSKLCLQPSVISTLVFRIEDPVRFIYEFCYYKREQQGRTESLFSLIYHKVMSDGPVYYSIFDHFWGATNQDVLLLP